MSLLGRATGRHLRRHPAQLSLAVLGVALGVAVVVSIDLAIQSARTAFRVSAETVAGRATHAVVGPAGSLDERTFTRLRVEAGVRDAAPVVEGLASSPALPGTALRVLGVDPFSEGPFRAWLAGSGLGFDVAALITTPGGVVIAAPTAARAGVAPGDSLHVRVEGRDRRLPVVGLLEPGDALARAGLRDLMVLDVASAQELLGTPGRLSRIDLRLDQGARGDAEARVRGSLGPGERLVAAGTREAALAGMIAAFDLNLTALSLLALVFGMFLIYNTMTFSVVQRRELLGSLRALGVTRGEVLRGVLREAAWIGGAGAVLGVGLGTLMGRGLVRMVTRTINDLYFAVSVDRLALPTGVLVKGALLGVAATLLASLPAAMEAAGAAPRVARTRSAVESATRRAVPAAAGLGGLLLLGGAGLLALSARALVASFAGLFLVILGMALLTPAGTVLMVRAARPLLARVGGVLGTMAARGVVTALSRTAPAMAALVVAVSVTVGLGVMIQSFRGTLVRWLHGTLVADVYVSAPSIVQARSEGTLDPEVVAALLGHPAVAERSTYRSRELLDGSGALRLLAIDLAPLGEAAFDFREGGGPEAFRAFRSGEAVFLSEPLAYRRGLRAGDTLRLPTAEGWRAYPVAAVFYDYGSDQGVVMMSRATYERAFDDRGVTSLGLFLRPGVDRDRVVRELEARVPRGQTLSIRTNAALREGSLTVFDRTFQVTAVLRLLAFVVAFVGVLSALMALELERARELGVLRANGMTPRQVRRLVTTQTGLLGMVAGVLSIPVGLVLAWVMIYVVNKRSFGWSLRMHVGPDVLLQAVGLALAGALLAGLYPAWRMARTSPAVALRDE